MRRLEEDQTVLKLEISAGLGDAVFRPQVLVNLDSLLKAGGSGRSLSKAFLSVNSNQHLLLALTCFFGGMRGLQ